MISTDIKRIGFINAGGLMEVDPEILVQFVDSLKKHGKEHRDGVATKKEICAKILNVCTTNCDALQNLQLL